MFYARGNSIPALDSFFLRTHIKYMPGKKRRRLNNQASEAEQFQKVKSAAERGDPEAQHDLAAFYATDESLGIRNESEAVKWYARAAAQGHGPSQYDLGFMLLLGEGMEKDVEKGLCLMEQAVASGWEYAARLLSDVYEKGLFGLEADFEKAAYWNERAGDFKNST